MSRRTIVTEDVDGEVFVPFGDSPQWVKAGPDRPDRSELVSVLGPVIRHLQRARVSLKETGDPDATHGRFREEETDPGADFLDLAKRALANNWFAVMGVHWSAHPLDVSCAMLRNKRGFRRVRRSELGQSIGDEVLDALKQRLTDAGMVLAVTDTRRSYRDVFVDEKVQMSLVHSLERNLRRYLAGELNRYVGDDLLRLRELDPGSELVGRVLDLKESRGEGERRKAKG